MGRTDSKVVLEEIAAEVRSCGLCPLAQGRTNAVPGEGPPNSRIVIVGEGPGREEDQTGRPFVGRAGRLLDSNLASIGMKRTDVYITNVVKCRPPNNRPPTTEEIETCTDAYLSRQLSQISPESVLLLGRTAAKAILGLSKLNDARKKPEERRGVVFRATYHPAAVLRNPHLLRKFRSDLRKSFASG